jgi:hypothetical protein
MASNVCILHTVNYVYHVLEYISHISRSLGTNLDLSTPVL